MRLAFFRLLACGALAPSAFATDLYQNFIILEASDLSPTGGTFSLSPPTRGTFFGTFSGTFSVDETNFPTLAKSVNLANVDIKTSTFGSYPGTTYTSGYIVVASTLGAEGETLDEDVVVVTSGAIQLQLAFIEVPNTFAGGQIIQADEVVSFNAREDYSGDAVAIDPAFITPEPGSIGMGGMGLAILAGAWRRRKSGRRKNRVNGVKCL